MAPKQSCAFVTFVKREVAEQAAKNTHKIPGLKKHGKHPLFLGGVFMRLNIKPQLHHLSYPSFWDELDDFLRKIYNLHWGNPMATGEDFERIQGF